MQLARRRFIEFGPELEFEPMVKPLVLGAQPADLVSSEDEVGLQPGGARPGPDHRAGQAMFGLVPSGLLQVVTNPLGVDQPG